jgi:hypothetical protein
MQYLRANLSRKVGRLVDWSGGFWERRYSAEPVLDDEALVGRLRYVLAHGVKEGLVERSSGQFVWMLSRSPGARKGPAASHCGRLGPAEATKVRQ